jgi:hypothetical protein
MAHVQIGGYLGPVDVHLNAPAVICEIELGLFRLSLIQLWPKYHKQKLLWVKKIDAHAVCACGGCGEILVEALCGVK